ncbi:unannotated protein [freshwater metagenome]|uniref:Unannotated protein n=1 Tax=freshwater metagenome TaxID=449393 RepID=A0A6J6VZP1_9ZZZZ
MPTELGDARAARVAVIDEHGGRPGVLVQCGRHPTHVPPVADGEQGQHADGGVLGGVQRTRQVDLADAGVSDGRVVEGEPERTGAQASSGQIETGRFEHSPCRELPALESGHLRRHFDLAEVQHRGAYRAALLGVHHADSDVASGLGVGVAVGRHHHRDACVEVERPHFVGPSLMQVHRARMHRVGRARGVDGADQRVVGQANLHLAAGPAAQPHARCGHPLARPHRARRREPVRTANRKQSVVHEVADPIGEGVVAPPTFVGVTERPFERRASEVRASDERVRGVDHGPFGWAFEQRPRMSHEPLIELVVARHHHGQGWLPVTADPADLLPRRGDGAREPVDDAGVERADVDTELERRRGDHGPEVAVGECVLDLASFVGQVSRTVRAHELGARRRAPLHLGRHYFGGAPTATERDHPMVGPDERGGEQRGFAVGREPRTAEWVGGWLQERDGSGALGRGVVGDGFDRRAAQCLGQGGRVADGGRAQHERRVGAVVLAQAPQAAQHVREVGSEHAPEHVHLVDDHEPQPHEERRPARMVGQQPAVQHLGVGEHHVGLIARVGALVRRRVAVVDRSANTREVVRAEGADLIVGQRFGRTDHERGRRAYRVEQGLGQRQLIAE